MKSNKKISTGLSEITTVDQSGGYEELMCIIKILIGNRNLCMFDMFLNCLVQYNIVLTEIYIQVNSTQSMYFKQIGVYIVTQSMDKSIQHLKYVLYTAGRRHVTKLGIGVYIVTQIYSQVNSIYKVRT